MGKQNNWLYASEKTRQHPVSLKFHDCVERIDDIIIREGGDKDTFTEEVAINLDKVEKNLARRQKRNLQKSVDMAFCIIYGKETNVVLTEIRLNVKKKFEISRSELEAKVRHSEEILISEIKIHKKYYYIFPKEKLGKANYQLRSLFKHEPYHIALDIEGLKELFFKEGN